MKFKIGDAEQGLQCMGFKKNKGRSLMYSMQQKDAYLLNKGILKWGHGKRKGYSS